MFHAWIRDAKTPAAVKLHFIVREVSTGKVAGEGDCEIAAGDGPERTGHATVALKNCRLWSPEDPFLYEVETQGKADVHKDRFGMRTFRLKSGMTLPTRPASSFKMSSRYGTCKAVITTVPS